MTVQHVSSVEGTRGECIQADGGEELKKGHQFLRQYIIRYLKKDYLEHLVRQLPEKVESQSGCL